MDEQQKKRHARIKLILKIVGFLLIAAGLVLAIIGFVNFINHHGSKFWCLMVGLPCCAFGGMITLVGFQREISRYAKNEAVPVINETAEEIRPAVRHIASAVKSEKGLFCECGEVNAVGSKFCKACGKPLKIICPYCNGEIDSDSEYCSHCGKKI